MRFIFLLIGFLYSSHAVFFKPNNCGCSRDPGGNKCTGSARPGALRLKAFIQKKFHLPKTLRTNIYNCPNISPAFFPFYVHREGRAVDFILGKKSVTPAQAEKIYQYAKSIACQVGIQEVLYNGRIWIQQLGEIPIPSGFPAGEHKDHVHIGLNQCGSFAFNYGS